MAPLPRRSPISKRPPMVPVREPASGFFIAGKAFSGMGKTGGGLHLEASLRPPPARSMQVRSRLWLESYLGNWSAANDLDGNPSTFRTRPSNAEWDQSDNRGLCRVSSEQALKCGVRTRTFEESALNYPNDIYSGGIDHL